MVLLWHELSAGEQRTTLIVLFEDGSLRIYVASPDVTNFWLRSSTPASSAVGAVATVARAEKKRKLPKMGELM
jgi:E3 ubiquitin-protein ligase UBR4